MPRKARITDYMMPKMDGLELTKRIRSKYPSTPILVVTGNGPVHDLLKSGATFCLKKPFSIFEIQNIVKIMLKLTTPPQAGGVCKRIKQFYPLTLPLSPRRGN